MRFDYPARVRWAVAFLVIITLYGSVSLLQMVMGRRSEKQAVAQGGDVDWTTMYESRFEPLRRDLPPDSVVGYLTDQPPDTGTGKDLRLTQYALAPIIVKATVKAELVVGNFHDLAGISEIVRREGLIVVRDYRNGVVLLRGKAE